MSVPLRSSALIAVALAVVALLVSGCGSGSVELEVVDPVISDAGGLASVYFRIANRGDVTDELVSVSVEGSLRTMLHATQIDDSGVVTMGPAGALRIEPGEQLVFEPGGLHVMVVDPPPLDRGETVAIALTFADAGEIEASARVVDPAEAGGGDGGGS